MECRESSSCCRPGAAAARRTHPSAARSLPDKKDRDNSPAGASSAAASGALGAADPLAVQVSDAPPGRPGRGQGHRGPGGGVSGRRRAEAQAQGPDAEIAHPAFCPGTSCGTSPGWNPVAMFAAVRMRSLPRAGGCGVVSRAWHPLKLASSEGHPEVSGPPHRGPRLGGARDLGDPSPQYPCLTPPLSPLPFLPLLACTREVAPPGFLLFVKGLAFSC